MKTYNEMKSDLEWIESKIQKFSGTDSDLESKLKVIRERISKELEDLDEWLKDEDWDRYDI